MLVKRPFRWSDVASSIFLSLFAYAIARVLIALGVPAWLCWSAFAVVLAARLTHGWVTTQRPMPAGPVPAAVRVPLDALTLGTLVAAVIQ